MNRRRRYTGSNPSLRRVLYRAHLGVALVAVFTAGLAVTLVGLLTLRAYADPNQQLIARSISYTVEAAVVFGDAQAAEESLALIASSEEVSSAIVYDRQGQTLASWHRESTGPLHLLEQQLAHWLLSAPTEQPILHDGQKIGSVEVKAPAAACCASCSPVSPAWSCACCLPPWAPSTCRGGWYAVSSARSTNWRRSRIPCAANGISRSAYRKPASPS